MRLMLLAPALLLLDVRPVDACIRQVNPPHALDSAYLDDTTPPTAVVARTSVALLREAQPSSCEDIGQIWVDVASLDDRAPTSRLGHRVRVVSGQPPAGLRVYDSPVSGTALVLWFAYTEEPIAFRLAVTAVDLNGNESAPVEIDIAHTPEAGGCAVGGGADVGLLALVGGALGIVARRRRRRCASPGTPARGAPTDQ